MSVNQFDTNPNLSVFAFLSPLDRIQHVKRFLLIVVSFSSPWDGETRGLKAWWKERAQRRCINSWATSCDWRLKNVDQKIPEDIETHAHADVIASWKLRRVLQKTTSVFLNYEPDNSTSSTRSFHLAFSETTHVLLHLRAQRLHMCTQYISPVSIYFLIFLFSFALTHFSLGSCYLADSPETS